MKLGAIVAGVVVVHAVAGCGGGGEAKKTTPKIVAVKKKPPPPAPKPVCIVAGDGVAEIGNASGGAGGAEFCVSSGNADASECFSVDLAGKKYERMTGVPTAQDAGLTPSPVRVETTPTEVTVCKGEDCKTLAPKVARPEGQLVAVANEQIAVVMLGDGEAGKNVAEVWDVAKAKKLTTIKYARGDFKCGVPKLLGSTIFISASVCAGPASAGTLYSAKGKKLGDAGGKGFGTYSEVVVQVKDDVWAFLEENAAVVVLQDVATGKVEKTIKLAALWTEEGEQPEGDALPMGNPGETALVRGGDGKVLVISGSPSPGHVGVIDVAAGTVDVIRAPRCPTAKPEDGADGSAPTDEPATDDEVPPEK
jgi:hypothetical protein